MNIFQATVIILVVREDEINGKLRPGMVHLEEALCVVSRAQ